MMVIREKEHLVGLRAYQRGLVMHELRYLDELWEWATTPRFSLDRSVKDQLQDRQYG